MFLLPFLCVTTCDLKKFLNYVRQGNGVCGWSGAARVATPVLTARGVSLAAFCKNSVDGLWYCFDDSDVQQLSEDEVCTQMAYILFYQRRTAIPSWSANSSVAGKAIPL